MGVRQSIAMKEYNSSLPLISIHIPKTAGVSVRRIFKGWFGKGYLSHYFNEATGEMPKKHNLEEAHSRENPIVIYGHFNRKRSFGVEHYYPEVDQFVTILRDPFEQAVSGYFYVRKNSSAWIDQSRVPKRSLRQYLLGMKLGILDYFPRKVTLDNYQEIVETLFIEIGITEFLDESMRRIAKKLNQQYDSESLDRLNVTERNQRVPYELREEFMENNPLEFAVYNYAFRKYTK